MTDNDPLRPEDRAALDRAIRFSAGTATLRRIRRLISDEEAAERTVRKLALAGLAIFLVACAVLAVLARLPASWFHWSTT